jgi:hypothetical protein
MPRGRIVLAVVIHKQLAVLKARAVRGHCRNERIAGSRDLQTAAARIERALRLFRHFNVRGKDTGRVATRLVRQTLIPPDAPMRSLKLEYGLARVRLKRFDVSLSSMTGHA